MARDLSFLDEGIAGGSRLTGLKDIPNVSQEDINAAVRQAGVDLGLSEAEIQAGISDPSKLTKLPGESYADFNARVTQAYKDFATPIDLTPEEVKQGYTVRWVRTGPSGQGEYRKIAPAFVSGPGGTTGVSGANTGVTGTDSTGQTFTTADGKTFTNYSDYITYQAKLDADKTARQSAYDLLYSQFKQYGLESLVKEVEYLIQQNVSPSEFAIKLQDTQAYQRRFAANQDRIKAGLKALTPAEYIGLEDQYQNIMRNYGLPASYWSKDSMGTQAGFNKFIANDVSAAELEDRIATAQKRVINADVNVTNALRQFYPDITNADILAYTLDPTNALENIKRKVTAAEIGGAALGQGLATSAASAEDLAKYGITKAQAQQGYGTIAEFLPSATKLGDIYAGQGLGAYDQATAEQEVFGTAGAAEAARKRKKLSELERATFGGQAGQAQGALARDRAGSI